MVDRNRQNKKRRVLPSPNRILFSRPARRHMTSPRRLNHWSIYADICQIDIGRDGWFSVKTPFVPELIAILERVPCLAKQWLGEQRVWRLAPCKEAAVAVLQIVQLLQVPITKTAAKRAGELAEEGRAA